jgi:flagellar biosynthetic protein FlhB
MSDADSEKTEEPTPEKLRKAREEQGQFPRSRDSGAVAASLAILIYLLAASPLITSTLREFSAYCFGQGNLLAGGAPTVVLQRLGYTLAVLVLPPVFIAATIGAAMGFVEAGFHPNLDLVAPKWERLDPISKLQQMLSLKETGINTVLSLGRVAVVTAVAWLIVKAAFPEIQKLARVQVVSSTSELAALSLKLAVWTTAALAVLAGLEYGKSWWQHHQQMMMSRQELKEELHQQEGDPRVKAQQRARGRDIARRGLRKEVKTADVIVTNPTHIAVALRYRAEQGAPMVTAKGYDEVAQFIKKVAREHNIPIIENKPLARALAEQVRPGRLIPVELYAAVAEVLAFVYRLKHRGLQA